MGYKDHHPPLWQPAVVMLMYVSMLNTESGMCHVADKHCDFGGHPAQ